MKKVQLVLTCNCTAKESCIQVNNFCIHHQASRFISRIMLNMTFLLRVVNESENVVVNQVVEEVNPSVEVGFDIYGTSLEPDFSVNQGKPRMHLTLPCVLQILSLLLFYTTLSDQESSGNLIGALPTLFFHIYLVTYFIRKCLVMLSHAQSGDYLSPENFKWIFGYLCYHEI